MPIKSLPALIGVVFAVTTAWNAPAVAAADARQIADSLVAAAGATGKVQATYDEVSAAGDAITVTGFKVMRTNAKTIEVPSIVISGATAREPGGFSAESIAFDGGTATRDKDVVTWSKGLIEDAVVPSADEIRSETDFRPFGKLVVNGLNITESNLSKAITAEEIRVVMERDADGFPTAFAAQISGVQFPAEVLKGRPQEKAIVDALGYEDFDVNVAVAGAFDRSSQTMTLNALTINTAEVGTISIKARVSGMSPGKIAATRIDAKARSEAKLEALEVRFDNAGIVERALDMHAALIWGTRDDAIAQVNAALPLVLNFLGNDAFQAKVATAFKSFLSDPQSISFSAAPSAPVPLEQILDTSRGGLKELPDLLSADVSAN